MVMTSIRDTLSMSRQVVPFLVCPKLIFRFFCVLWDALKAPLPLLDNAYRKVVKSRNEFKMARFALSKMEIVLRTKSCLLIPKLKESFAKRMFKTVSSSMYTFVGILAWHDSNAFSNVRARILVNTSLPIY